jgi:hypothetical protein
MVGWLIIRTYFNYNNSICSNVTSCRRDGTYRSESSVVSRPALWWLMLQVCSEISQVKVVCILFAVSSRSPSVGDSLTCPYFLNEQSILASLNLR